MTENKRAVVARLEDEGRDLVARFLADHGFEVTATATGAEAIARIEAGGVDLVVADAVLPKLSGFELCRKARAIGASPAFVLVLEETDTYGRGRARAEGVDRILTEPLVADDLEEILRVRPGDGESIEGVMAAPSGKPDRFLKDVLRGAGKSDPIMARVSDPLTGLHNKGFITMKLEEEFKKAQRYGNPFALLLVEIDNLEDVRRTHGKSAAQEMLLEVAGVFLCESRDVDAAGRVDDGRFVLLLPNTDLKGARVMADRVFQQVCSRAVVRNGESVPIRVSVGLVALPGDDARDVDDFLERALRAMRTARQLGGNRICAYCDPAPSES